MKRGIFYVDADIITEMNGLINKAKYYGFDADGVSCAKEYMKAEEYDICINFLLVQMFEYYIEVERDFVDSTYSLLSKMGLPVKDYQFMDELCSEEI